MSEKYKVLLALFILNVLMLSSAYLFIPTHFQSLDNKVRDLYFKFRGAEEASKDIVIIDIDEKSIKELGQWPWERDKLARILSNLTNLGAGIIGIDIIFSEADRMNPKKLALEWGIDSSSLPDYDLSLSESIASSPTILSYVFNFDSNNTNEAPHIPAIFVEKSKQEKEFFPLAKGVLTNIDILQNSAYSSGYMNNIPDESGVIRSVPLMIKYDEQLYPSLSFEMYRIAIGAKKVVTRYSQAGIESIKVSKQRIRSDRFGRLHLNFKGPFRSYKYISCVDILNDKVEASEIEGKFVLIGTSAYGLMDMRSTPLDSVIAGVEIHANMIDNLLNNDMLSKPAWGEIADLAIIILISFIVIFIYVRLSLVTLIFVYTVTLFGVIFANYYLLFTQLIILNAIYPLFSISLSLIIILGVNYMFETKQKNMIKSSFSKKVSQQVMEDLLSNNTKTSLSTREVEVSIYFSDIRSFTSISETLKSPKKITSFLNYYMNIMVQSIEKRDGTIDKFIGDAVMAYWNAPNSVPLHADNAVQAALEQISQRDFLNVRIKKEFGFEVDYGIGINTGAVVVGEIGSRGRSDYTVIGDAVNLASRLEGLCKPYKVRLIISEFTRLKLKEKYVMQLLDIVIVKGKHEAVKIYEVLSMGEASIEKQRELLLYEEAHESYVKAEFQEAKVIFDDLYKVYEKHLYQLYSERCIELMKKNIKEFNGVFEFSTK